MTHCHENNLELWKKFRIFRVVVGGSVSAQMKKMKKSVKKLVYVKYFSYISTVID